MSSMFNGLDESLTTVLRSVISDNFPGSYQTYLKSVVGSSQYPTTANLFTGDNVDLNQLFFSDDPDQNFPNTFSKYTQVVSSGSDLNVASPAGDEEVKVIWGRHGSDDLNGFNPSADLDGKRRIDFLVGDLLEEQLFGSSPGPFMSWGDTFILGDWQTPYYAEDDEDSLGLNQFALIIDFNPSEDIIQLHGTSQDYELVETSLGTALFWRQENSFDLIGVVGGISVQDLSLDADYFEFKGNTTPDTVLQKAEQIGTVGVDYLFGSGVDTDGNIYIGGGTDGSLAEQNLGARDAWLSKYDSNGNQLWSKQFGTSGAELIFDKVVDENNNIYVTGNTTGELGNNTNQGGVDVFLAKYNSDGNQEWIKQFGTVTFEDYTNVTTDKDGNVYLSGHTIGSLGGDNQNLGQVLGQGVDGGVPSTDPYVFKFDSDGNELWRAQLGTVTLDDNWGLAVDQDGNVFLGGNTKGDFGGQNASSAGEYDSWLVKLDKDGQEEWVKQFGTPEYDFLWAMETDSQGNLYVTGWTLGDLAGENVGSYDVWLAKYDTNGNQVWIKQFGSTGDDAPFRDGIEIDSNDNIFLTGYTNGDFGAANAGSYDAWVAQYDTDGNQLWIQQFGTPDYDTASTVSADDDGNLYVSGITDGSLGDSNAGSYDSWVVKLDANTGQIQDFTGTNDQFNGSNANDFIEGNAGDDTIYGNGGEDTLIGGDGDNLVVAGPQTDIVTTGDGDDTVYGNGGEDTVIGGDGDNLVVVGSQTDIVTTGDGDDTVYGNGGEDTVIGGDGDNLIFAGSQADTITTGDGDDTVYGNGGEDTQIAGDGDNLVFGGSQADTITTGNGNDTIYGNGGEDTVIAGDGDNLVFGGSQADTITTGNGNDTIYGNGGDDRIDSGNGLDTIWLGTGNVSVVLQTGEGYDDIKNFQLGATKFEVSSLDTLSLSDSNGGVQIFDGSDLLAFVSWQNVDTFRNNIDEIFTT
ncbi:MAG: SBBP repeat-containing protein [Calothrix sp. MO_167.B42]|nr:SBBP repeat-containing protein [Calothrix sp. MO_167.B42]